MSRQPDRAQRPRSQQRASALPVERRLKILERVAEQEAIQASELARDFGVSEMTVRRDIQRLERDGFLRQTYGGATVHLTRSVELAFNARALQHAREKRLIGMEAAALVADARVVFVGIGTTAEQFARFIRAREDVLVVTASLTIASLLGTRPLQVVVLGGRVRRNELSCNGPVAQHTLQRYQIDVAVVGAAGVSAEWGLTDLDDDEAEINRIAIERARKVVVIADASKLGQVAATAVAPLHRVATLVTDASAQKDELEKIEAIGVRVLVASPHPARDQEADRVGQPPSAETPEGRPSS